MKKYTFKQSVELKCYNCIVDPLSVGTKKEQVACCIDSDCPNHSNRPMPKPCRKNGEHQIDEIAKTRGKVDRLQNAKSARERLPRPTPKPLPFDDKNPPNTALQP